MATTTTVNLTDPLSMLREFYSHKKTIVEEVNGDKMIFGKLCFPRNAQTNFPIYGAGKGANGTGAATEQSKQYYTIESLKFFMDHLHLSHPMYLKRTTAEKSNNDRPSLQLVSRVDRMPLISYLTGVTNVCTKLDPNGPIVIPMTYVSKKTNTDTVPRHMGAAAQSSRVAVKRQTAPVMSASLTEEQRLLLTSLPDADSLFRCRPQEVIPSNQLVEAVGAEKMAELISKRRAVKMKEIAPMFSEEGMNHGNVISKAQEEALKIMVNERNYTDRNTILRSTKIEFLKPVTNLLLHHNIKMERIRKFGAGNNTTLMPLSTTNSERSKPPRTSETKLPYSRYDQVADIPEETKEFRIDPLNSFSRNFQSAMNETLANDNDKAKTVGKTDTKITPAKRQNEDSSNPGSVKRRRYLMPIIIVPEQPPSIITVLNAQEILQDMRFVSHDEKKTKGYKRINEIIIQRQRNGSTVPYKIMCTPEKLSMQEWERVVAIFITGKAWQFKGWPWDANPVQICSNVSAYHLKFDGSQVDPNVKLWPVKIIQISQNRRHLDRAAMIEFWTSVDEFIAQSKPHLNY